ncbi:DUF4174 domain-containing protein [Actibacterium sp. 188UL27-1]|uniref:DUF4174 domain-containing protein n=1 Tax=Actibacterium sp. 188UL27-1 TaxID=2786961 RepID=UPI00195D0F12|nr:DUF4174 domain-containing protein [Actibacterium sp. 188UL27-1]MBM7069562.1 DUF4174 domain-containing protein [Actibacterium sp. 188UL27-1]
MKPIIPLLLAIGLTGPAALAQDTTSAETAATPEGVTVIDANQVDLGEFLWQKRPVVVFAQTQLDPAFTRQMELLTARSEELRERDVVIITDTDPSEPTELRRKLRPRGFMLVLIGKDGGVKLRKPFPWDVREISRSIDKMPLRKQELRDRKLELSQ